MAVTAVMLMASCEIAAGGLAKAIGSGVGALVSSEAPGTVPLMKY